MHKDNLPKYLFRKNDGERFTLAGDFYTMDNSNMANPYKYTYNNLIKSGFVDDYCKCRFVNYESENDGHGDDE